MSDHRFQLGNITNQSKLFAITVNSPAKFTGFCCYVHDFLSYRRKAFPLHFNTAVVITFWPRFCSKSDCHGVFHAEKSRALRTLFVLAIEYTLLRIVSNIWRQILFPASLDDAALQNFPYS